MLRIVWACESGRSSSSCVTSPKVSRPKASGNCTGAAPDGVVVMSMLSFWYRSERAGAGLHCLGADSQLKLGSVQRRTEDRTPWFEQAARAQTVEPHRVVPDALDEFRHHVHHVWIVAGNPERATFRRAFRSAFVFELVVANVVEGLDDRRPHEPALDDLAAAVSMIFEHLLNAVDGLPVVHRIDDDLAVQQGGVQRRELVKRDRQHHKVCLLDGLGCPSWLSPRRQHLYDQLDQLRFTRGRARHLVARLYRDPCDDRADVTRPEDGDPWQPRMQQSDSCHRWAPPVRPALTSPWRWRWSDCKTSASASNCSGVSASTKCFLMALKWGAPARRNAAAPLSVSYTSATPLSQAQASRRMRPRRSIRPR